MKVIVDENLPTRLVGWLIARGAEAAHVSTLGLKGTPDKQVWAEALAQGAAVLSRDSDFIDIARTTTTGCAIKLTIGNCSTAELFAWLEPAWPTLLKRVQDGERIIEI
jgi:predicted nuclease of predicted toxin-antitoxin system